MLFRIFIIYQYCSDDGFIINNQSQAAVSTSIVPSHVRAFFKLTDLFPPCDTNDVIRNLDR